MDTLHAALKAIYNPSTDTVVQSQANQWLNNFSSTPEAWDAALTLLDLQHPGTYQFFAANMLYTKARNEWSKLHEGQKAQLQAAIMSKLQQHIQGQGDKLVVQRLGLAVAAMAVRSGTQASMQLCNQALQLAANTQSLAAVLCGLAMLAEVVSEASSLDSARAGVLQEAFKPCRTQVLGLAQDLLSRHSTAGDPAVLVEVLQCLTPWCQDITDTTRCSVTLQQICTDYPALLSSVINLFASESERLSQVAASLACSLLSQAPEETYGREGAAWRNAALTAVSHLVALKPRVTAAGDAGVAAAQAVARAGTALSEACTPFVAGALQPADSQPHAHEGAMPPAPPGPEQAAALQLAELMMTCLSRPEPSVAQAVVDYLINLNTVPRNMRVGPLQADIYASALPLLLRQAQFPPGFSSWDESDVDEDNFIRFRDHILLELLETCYNVLGIAHLVAVQQVLDKANSWQEYEAGCYAIRAISMPLKLTMLGRDRADPSMEPMSAEGLEKARQASAMMHGLTTSLCTQPANSQAQRFMSSSPWLINEVCRLLAEYAAWFGKADLLAAEVARAAAASAGSMQAAAASAGAAPIMPAISFTLQAFQLQAARAAAAQAFRNLCVRCASQLTSADVLPGLLNATLQVLAPAPEASLAQPTLQTQSNGHQSQRSGGGRHLTADPLERIMEALARLITELPADSAAAAGLTITQPLIQRAQAFAQAGTTGHPHALQLLAQELQLLGTAVQYMLSPQQHVMSMAGPAGRQATVTTHPTIQLVQAAWPVLSGVAQHESCRKEPAVVDALCNVYKRCLASAGQHGRELLPPLMTSVTAILSSDPHPGCCAVLGATVELFGELRSVPQIADMQAQALVTAVNTITAAVQAPAGGIAVSHLELVQALYDMADLYFVFARDTLLASPALPQLMAYGAHVVSLREREPVVSALGFLTHALGCVTKLTGDSAATQRSILESCAAAHGAQLLHALLMAVADSCPRQLARPLAGLLYVLLYNSVWKPAAVTWLNTSLNSPAFAGIASGRLSAEQLGRVQAIMLRPEPLPRGRFDVFTADLSAVLRGESDADVLLAYEM